MGGWHDFRHTFSNEWVAHDGNMRILQEILGHSSINTTAFFYTKPNISDLKAGHHRHSVLESLPEYR